MSTIATAKTLRKSLRFCMGCCVHCAAIQVRGAPTDGAAPAARSHPPCKSPNELGSHAKRLAARNLVREKPCPLLTGQGDTRTLSEGSRWTAPAHDRARWVDGSRFTAPVADGPVRTPCLATSGRSPSFRPPQPQGANEEPACNQARQQRDQQHHAGELSQAAFRSVTRRNYRSE